jgi:hypothetical protein
MKVAQNDETNPDTRSVRLSHVPSTVNTQPFPLFSSVRKYRTPGILSRMLFPFTSITRHCVRSPLSLRIAMLCFVLLMLAVYLYCFLPPSSLSIDPGTDAVPETDATQEPDATVDNPSLLPEQPGKPLP